MNAWQWYCRDRVNILLFVPILAEFYQTILYAPLGAKPLGFREYFAFFEPNMEGELLANILPELQEYSPIFHDFS